MDAGAAVQAICEGKLQRQVAKTLFQVLKAEL
jgi:hypothetical protein